MIEKYNNTNRTKSGEVFDNVMFRFFAVIGLPITVIFILILITAFAYRLGFIPPF